MTTFTSDDLEQVRKHLPKPGDLFRATDSGEFRVLAISYPNEEPDAWIEYANTLTGQVYSARLEAFTSRFHPLPSPDGVAIRRYS
jgi:hypothetical protein